MADSVLSHRWLLLIHRLPPKPDYVRIKVARRLRRVGAVALKRTVYALPATDQSREDFEWLAKEIMADGGEATLCEAAFLDSAVDHQLIEASQTARAADYQEIANATLRAAPDVERLQRRLTEVAALDHFNAPGRSEAEAALARLKRARS